MSAPVHLFEAGVITEQRYLGIAEAPAALAGDVAALVHPAKRVRIPFLPRDRYLTAARESCRTLADAVASSLREGARPVILGGECTIVAGSIPGALAVEPELALVYFDAHGDFNTLATTPSHLVGGMCLAHVCGLRLAPLLWTGVKAIAQERVALVGGRDLDIGEAGNLVASKVRHIPFDREHRGAEGLVAFARRKPVWVHIDVDIVDPSEMPAVSFPAAGGPSIGDLIDVLASLADSARVRGVELCAYDPRKDAAARPLVPLISRSVVAALGAKVPVA